MEIKKALHEVQRFFYGLITELNVHSSNLVCLRATAQLDACKTHKCECQVDKYRWHRNIFRVDDW